MQKSSHRPSGENCGWAMLKAVRETPGVRKALTILPDSVRNYLSKFINDDWMREHGFPDEDGDQQA